MWKPANQTSPTPAPTPKAEPPRYAPPAPEPPPIQRSVAPAPQEQATIGKSLIIKGEVTGSESLYIDGRVEGSINLPGNRVTVGRNGVVSANITAREIVILGKVRGNVNASDRFDIRSEGSLTGDIVAQRVSIEEGAFFKGAIEISRAAQKGNNKEAEPETAKTALRA